MTNVDLESVEARVCGFLRRRPETSIWSHVSVTAVPMEWNYPANVLVLVVRSAGDAARSRSLQLELEGDLGDHFEVVLTVSNVLDSALGQPYGRSAYFDHVASTGTVVQGVGLDSFRTVPGA